MRVELESGLGALGALGEGLSFLRRLAEVIATEVELRPLTGDDALGEMKPDQEPQDAGGS